MEQLAKLFNSSARLKLLRLFVFNDDSSFSIDDVEFRSSVPKESVRKEIRVLVAADIIRKKTGKDGITYGANKKFQYYLALQNFLKATTTIDDASINNSLKKAGSLRLVVLSGLFTNEEETKADLLVVGDKLDERLLEKAVHHIEAELGRELRFAHFSTEDFRYRLGVYDRLLRDIFDYSHRTILDKIGMAR